MATELSTSNGASRSALDADSSANASLSHEHHHIKELHRSIRNINKKLSSMAKVDAIIIENAGLTLDELVASRKINTDQKAQALKKPALQAQLAQLEEQLVQFKKFEEEVLHRARQEKDKQSKAHERELSELREAASIQNVQVSRTSVRRHLLTISQFLKTAAQRRMDEPEDAPESRAFESILSYMYGGDKMAVDMMESLINGASDPVLSTEGGTLSIDYARVKDLATAGDTDDVDDDATLPVTGSDPTITNATLTEIAELQTYETDGQNEANLPPQPAIDHALVNPVQAAIDDGAANAAASQEWGSAGAVGDSTSNDIGDGWVRVPRDQGETEATPIAAPSNATNSWADDVVIPTNNTNATSGTHQASQRSANAASNDGFREVHHRTNNRSRGGNAERGRGGRRGGRGDGRGSGRGRGRGNRDSA